MIRRDGFELLLLHVEKELKRSQKKPKVEDDCPPPPTLEFPLRYTLPTTGRHAR